MHPHFRIGALLSICSSRAITSTFPVILVGRSRYLYRSTDVGTVEYIIPPTGFKEFVANHPTYILLCLAALVIRCRSVQDEQDACQMVRRSE